MRNLLSGSPWFHHFFAKLDPNFCKVDCLGLVNVRFKFPLHFAVASCAITTCTKKLLETKNQTWVRYLCLVLFYCFVFFNLLILKLKIHNAVTTFVQSHLKFYPFREYKKMGASGQNVVYLKSIQVIVRLHIFSIFSFLAKMLSCLSRNFCQKWKYRKNMQADHNFAEVYLKYLFTYLDNSGSSICFLLISNFWNNDILFQRRLNFRGYFKKMN